MSEFFHGARATIKINKTFAVTPAASGIVFAVGTAPVNQVGTYPDIVCANSFEEAKAALGYSDNWDKYTLCEVMHTQFRKYGVGPVFLVNVADPTLAANKTAVASALKTIVDGVVELPELRRTVQTRRQRPQSRPPWTCRPQPPARTPPPVRRSPPRATLPPR